MGEHGPSSTGRLSPALSARLSRRGADDPRHPWPDGRLPKRAYVVVDGLWSRSTPDPLFPANRPWFEVLTTTDPAPSDYPGLQAIDQLAVARGFSYFATGRHYAPADTVQNVEIPAERLGVDYGPQELPTTYLAFSLGGVVATLGLASWLMDRSAEAGAKVGALVLVQPAFLPSVGFASVIPGTLIPLVLAAESATSTSGYAMLDDVLAKLSWMTRERGILVYLLYWPGDGILSFRDPLPSGRPPLPALLAEAGVTVRPPLNLTFPAEQDPFVQHCGVARHGSVLEAIRDLLVQHLGIAVG